MPTKNVNTNINNIKIEIPKQQQRQYKPKMKSIKQAEEELNQLENADAGYNMGQPISISISQPPTINPSVYGFSHLPIQREISTTSTEEPIVMPEEPVAPEVAPEEPVAPKKRKGGRPLGSKNKSKIPVGIPTTQTQLTDYVSKKPFGGYETDIGGYGDFEKRQFLQAQQDFKKNIPPYYIQSAKDIQLGQGGGLQSQRLPALPVAKPIKEKTPSLPKEVSAGGGGGSEGAGSEGEEIVIITKRKPKQKSNLRKKD